MWNQLKINLNLREYNQKINNDEIMENVYICSECAYTVLLCNICKLVSDTITFFCIGWCCCTNIFFFYCSFVNSVKFKKSLNKDTNKYWVLWVDIIIVCFEAFLKAQWESTYIILFLYTDINMELSLVWSAMRIFHEIFFFYDCLYLTTIFNYH
jgi:hypothetical protein